MTTQTTRKDGLTGVLQRKFFYRDGLRGAIKVLLLSILLNIALVGAIIFLAIAGLQKEPRYFATTATGGLIQMVPLNRPLITDEELFRWSAEAATSVYVYDFVNYQSQLQAASKYFTDEGWSGFMEALGKSKTLEMVKEKRMVVSAVPTGAAVLVDRGLIGGRAAWKVRIPMLVSFQSSSELVTKPLVITMTIVRSSVLEKERGIAIKNFISSER